MKTLVFIILFFLSIPLAYLAYLNFNEAGAFTNNAFSSKSDEEYQLVSIDIPKLSFILDNSSNIYSISSKEGSVINLPANTANLKDFFKDWTQIAENNAVVLNSPNGCNYINFVLRVDSSKKKLSDNLERVYCTINEDPNFSLIP